MLCVIVDFHYSKCHYAECSYAERRCVFAPLKGTYQNTDFSAALVEAGALVVLAALGDTLLVNADLATML